MTKETKACSECGKVQPREDFPKNRVSEKGVVYRKAYCKECGSKKYRENHIKRKFGLTTSEYTEMHGTQGGVCMICGREEKTVLHGKIQSLAIDHDHADGKVRGLLCTKCNKGLGHFEDNIDLLASAISYLKNAKYNKREIA